MCLERSLVPTTGAKFEGLVGEYLVQDYSMNDFRLPNGLCGNCSQKLRAYKKKDFARVLPEFPVKEYVAMAKFRSPRGDVKCHCFPCSTYQTVGLNSSNKRKRKAGRPPATTIVDVQRHGCSSNRGVFCLRCIAMIVPGRHHPFTSAGTVKTSEKMSPKGPWRSW